MGKASSPVAHQAGAYPGFCSIKRLGVFLRKICSENDDFESDANKMETFLEHLVIRMT